MEKVVDYIIVRAHNAEQLSIEVRDEIKNGFEPFGSIVFSIGNYPHQTMVKYQTVKGKKK